MAPARASAPIIRVTAPRPLTKTKTKHRRKGGGGGHTKTKAFAIAAAGLALGYLDRPGGALSNLPTIPLLGKAGTLAVGLYFLAPKTGIWAEATAAAIAVAAYELGNKGSISGDIAPQVRAHGLAAQV